MNKLLSIALVALLAACSVPTKPQLPPDAITCHNKQDSRLDFTYLPQNAKQWHSLDYNVNVYLIDTVGGQQIAINSLELENYNCTKVVP